MIFRRYAAFRQGTAAELERGQHRLDMAFYADIPPFGLQLAPCIKQKGRTLNAHIVATVKLFQNPGAKRLY